MTIDIETFEPGFTPEMAKVQLRRADASAFNDALLEAVVRTIHAAGRGRVERLILYGSRARGDHRTDSDYDFLVLARPGADRNAVSEDIDAAMCKLDLPVGTDWSVLVREHDFLGQRTILTHNVRTEGVEM
jgi:predicted nucleotidyltransferase